MAAHAKRGGEGFACMRTKCLSFGLREKEGEMSGEGTVVVMDGMSCQIAARARAHTRLSLVLCLPLFF